MLKNRQLFSIVNFRMTLWSKTTPDLLTPSRPTTWHSFRQVPFMQRFYLSKVVMERIMLYQLVIISIHFTDTLMIH